MKPDPADSERLARIEQNTLRQIDERLAREDVPLTDLVELLRVLQDSAPFRPVSRRSA